VAYITLINITQSFWVMLDGPKHEKYLKISIAKSPYGIKITRNKEIENLTMGTFNP